MAKPLCGGAKPLCAWLFVLSRLGLFAENILCMFLSSSGAVRVRNFCDTQIRKVVDAVLTFCPRDTRRWRICAADFVDVRFGMSSTELRHVAKPNLAEHARDQASIRTWYS